MKLIRGSFGVIMVIISFILSAGCSAQQKNPWSQDQLVEPAVLAKQLDLPENEQPVIIDVGPAGVIKGAVEAGPAEKEEGIRKLKTILKTIPKNKEVVIYCGCCPFDKCPNVRPAFNTLLNLGFKKPRLLNLSHNLKADWIDKGYPLADE